eukprot:Phypoly_transcript_06626.p1 GENE.Phypoly_transcript_06626~~Phypoly_transcript_06626.p1  ORF type:complete len:581 (+),score=104.13 Phypoly_transcript_06626:41-1744(+)
MAGELSAQSYEQMDNPQQYFEEVSAGTNPMTRATPAYAPYTSTAGYRDLGGSAPYMDPALLKRPARKQVSNRSYFEDHPSDGQDYNIWYHKRPGFRQDKFEERENPGTRCNVLTDAGKTKANKKSPFCIYFAQGRCSQGSDCQYHHRIPNFEDEDRHDLAHDIFGRERHATDREDMSGVGNFTRECRTLYVGCVKMTGNIEESIKRHFEEWGPIEYSRAIHTKSIAFVRYYLRASAEFAKEAMNNQSLDNNDVLMIRWATDDTNPIAKEYEEKRKHLIAADALNKRLKIMGAADQATMYYQITGEYPNTNPQFSEGQDTYSYEFAGYSTTHTNEQHPYASLAAARKAALEQHQANAATGVGGGGKTDLATTAVPSYYDGYNQNDPYTYYYQYAYPGYTQQSEAAPYTEFVPTYKTAEAALAEQEDEEEEEEREKLAVPPGMGKEGENKEREGGEEGENSTKGEGEEGESTKGKGEGGEGEDSELQSFYATVYSGTSEGASESASASESESASEKSASESESAKVGESAKVSEKAGGKTNSGTKKTSTSKPNAGQIRKESTVKKPNKK